MQFVDSNDSNNQNSCFSMLLLWDYFWEINQSKQNNRQFDIRWSLLSGNRIIPISHTRD